jgi:hypothetical protein
MCTSPTNMALFKDENTLDIKKANTEDDPDDEEVLEQLPSNADQALTGRELVFKHTGFPWHDVLMEENSSTAYFAETHRFSRNKPDITLHRGAEKGPVAGAAHYRWKRSLTLGVGPDDLSMVWTEFQRGHLFDKRHFTFEWEGQNYVLQRASSAEHEATGAARLLRTHFKVVNESTDDMVALYISKSIGTTKGTLKLKPGIGEDLEILCILGVTAWRDKMRRRRSNGGGGG